MKRARMKSTNPEHLKSIQFMSPFMTPAKLHFSLPLTEIHRCQLVAGCPSDIPEHVGLMSVILALDGMTHVRPPKSSRSGGNPDIMPYFVGYSIGPTLKPPA